MKNGQGGWRDCSVGATVQMVAAAVLVVLLLDDIECIRFILYDVQVV